MAQKNIIIGIKIEGKSEAKKQLDNIIKQLSNNKIKLNIDNKTLNGSLSQFNKTLNSMNKNLNNTLGQNNALLNQGINKSNTLGNSLKNGLFNSGLYLSTYQMLRKIINLFENAIDYVKEVDKYKTNIQMITNSSAIQVESMINSYKTLAEKLHATNTEMLSGIEEYSRAGYNEELTKGMLENSIIGSKLSNQDVEETSNQLIAIRNAYDMTAEEVGKVTDALSLMDSKASTTFAEISEAMKNTSYNAQLMGTSYQDLISYITVASEATRSQASKIGNSLNSIYSRYSNIKLGNLDDDGKSINDTEKALERIGIKIRDTKDQFRDFDDVLKEFMTKIKNNELSQVDILAGVQALAGTRNKQTLLAIINNMDRLNELQQEIGESAGIAKQKFDEFYNNSLEAKTNDLKRATQDFYSNLVSSDGLKEGIELLTKFIDTFGDLPTIVTLATSTIVLFKRNAINNLFIGMDNCIQKMLGLISTTTTLNDIFNKLTWNILSNPVGFLAITMVTMTTYFANVRSEVEKTEEELLNFNKEFSETFQEPQQAQELLNNYKSLSDELEGLQENTDEYKTKEEELKNIQEELTSIYPEINNLLNDNKNSKDTNIQKTQELIDKEKELQRIKAKEVLEKNNINSYSDFEELINKYKAFNYEVKQLTELSDKGIKTGTIRTNVGGIGKAKVDVDGRLKSSSETTEKLLNQIQAIRGAYITLDKQGTIYENIADKTQNTLKGLGISFDDTTNSITNYTEEIENAGIETEDTTNKVEDLAKAFSSANDSISLIEDTLKEYQENGVLSGDTISKILSSGNNELIAALGDKANFEERLNNILVEQKNLRQQNFEEAIKQANEEINVTQEVTNANADAYNTDVQNKANAEQAKANATKKSSENQNKATVNTANQNAKVIKTDTENLMNALNSKLDATESFINGSGHIYTQLANKQAELYKDDFNNYDNMTQKKWELLQDYIKKDYSTHVDYYKKYVELQEAMNPSYTYKDIQNEWASNPKLNKYTYDLIKATYNPVNIGSTSNPSTSDNKDYSVDNLENLYDRYLKINTAIDMLNNNLEILKEKQGNLVGSDYLNSLKQEINSYKEQQDLIKQKIAEQDKERWDLRVKLDSAGFTFEANNINSQILNYENQLKALTNAANAMADSDEESAEAKKKAQERVKDLNETIKDYNTLISQTIPATQKEWEALNNSIKEVYKTMSDLVADGESKMYDIFEYYADKKTEHLEEQLDLLDRLHGKEAQQEELASKQSELAKIKEQMNLYELDNSANGKAKLKVLQDQYDKLLKEMNDTIKDNQYEGVKQQMEDEKQAIEDSLKPENINKLINDGLVNGFIKVGNQTIQLNDAINDMTSNTVVGFQSMIKEANDYNNIIKNVQSTLKDINISSINSNLGYDTSAMTKAINNNITNKSTYYSPNYTINVNASGLNEQTVSKMILDEIKEYDKTWK